MTKQDRLYLYRVLGDFISANKDWGTKERQMALSLLETLRQCESKNLYDYTIARCKSYLKSHDQDIDKYDKEIEK